MVERVVGYQEIEKEEIFSRPCKWNGEGKGDFKTLKPIKVKRVLHRPIFEDLGPHVFTTVDAPELPRFTVYITTGKKKK